MSNDDKFSKCHNAIFILLLIFLVNAIFFLLLIFLVNAIFILLLIFLVISWTSLLPYTDWKSKSDECEKVIDELKEQNSNVASTLAKLDRQVKSKVGFSNSCPLQSRVLLCIFSSVMAEVCSKIACFICLCIEILMIMKPSIDL